MTIEKLFTNFPHKIFCPTATGYGTLVNLLRASVRSPMQEYGAKLDNLGAYCDLMHSHYWSNAPVPEPVEVG
ncbi:MAG: hypothetical protein AAGA83_20420 [Cyanobacteria bacterium P01_F01_bin.116]